VPPLELEAKEYEALRLAMREANEEMVRVVVVWRWWRDLISTAEAERGVGGGACSYLAGGLRDGVPGGSAILRLGRRLWDHWRRRRVINNLRL
jgi:hypothetical protein